MLMTNMLMMHRFRSTFRLSICI